MTAKLTFGIYAIGN